MKRGIQHGQPQMTITDLLGSPLPKDLVNAERPDDIRVAWRKWLGMRVKIIDEYNRIPTRTQSALLTVMGDNYAEVYDQIYECPEAAWYLTANDDAGGGTYDVIEALRDRIDVVVKALHFNPRFLGELLERIEAGVKPEEIVPASIVFTEAELDRMSREVLAVTVPPEIRRRIEMFASQFELCEAAAAQFEYRTKDTLKLSGLDWHTVTSRETGKDRVSDIGSTTRNGLSVRALMTSLVFVKAMAYLRGDTGVSLEDVRQILPFVLHDKLVPDHDSPFFEAGTTRPSAWIASRGSGVFSISRARSTTGAASIARIRWARWATSCGGASRASPRRRCRRASSRIERLPRQESQGRKLYGPTFDDVLALKSMHQRYTNYLRWLRWRT